VEEVSQRKGLILVMSSRGRVSYSKGARGAGWVPEEKGEHNEEACSMGTGFLAGDSVRVGISQKKKGKKYAHGEPLKKNVVLMLIVFKCFIAETRERSPQGLDS